MKNLSALSRCALSICVAASLFAGCGGLQPPIGGLETNATTSQTSASRPASGGAFWGAYSGAYKQGFNKRRAFCFFKFQGIGHALFLGQGTEKGHQTTSNAPCKGQWYGYAILTSAANQGDTITVRLQSGGYSPCTNSPRGKVLRGTGKFAQATGFLYVTFTCSNGTYRDQWSGTLNF